MKQENIKNALRLLAKSSALILISTIVAKLLSYLYRVAIARTLGPAEYGLFSLALVISSLFITFSSLGLNEGLLRYIPLYRGKKEAAKLTRLIRSSFLILTLASVCAGALLFIFARPIALSFFHNQDLVIYLRFFSILIPLTTISNGLIYTLRAFEKMQVYALLNFIIPNITRVIFLAAFLFIGWKSGAIIASSLIAAGIVFLGAYLACKHLVIRLLKKSNAQSNPRILHEVLVYSWSAFLVIISAELLYWTDTFVIGYFKDATAVGYYNAALPIAALLTTIPMLFISLYFPLIVKAYARKNMIFIRELSKQVIKWILMLTIPLALLIIAFPNAFITILFGADYLAAKTSLQLLTVGAVFVSIGIIAGNLISMMGKPRILLAHISIGLLVNVVLDILLVPRYGISGAAFATMLVNILLMFSYFVQVKRQLGMFPFRRKLLLVPVAAGAALLILIFLYQFIEKTLGMKLILLGVFVLIYIAFLFLFRALDRNDLMIVQSIKNKLFNRVQ